MNDTDTPVFGLCGHKKAGKTGLMIRLVHHFTQAGLTVGTIKHDGHDFAPDVPGTDSRAHREAGARRTLIFSARRQALFIEEPPHMADLLKPFDGLDLVLVEGMKDGPWPKALVLQPDEAPYDVPNRVALVGGHPRPGHGPWLGLDDIESLAELIMTVLGLK